MSSLSDIVSSLNLKNIERANFKGASGCEFYSCEYGGASTILKIGSSERSLREIEENSSIYKLLGFFELGKNNPMLHCGEDFILMRDLTGSDLATKVNSSFDPREIYSRFFAALKEVYVKTLRVDKPASYNFLSHLFSDEVEGRYLKNYLIERGLIQEDSLSLLKRVRGLLEKISPDYVAFSTGGEFEPEHLYLDQDGNLIFLDPRKPSFGNPLFEVAILKELLGLYKMKQEDVGREECQKFIDELSHIMKLSHKQKEANIALAKIRQGSLSARFRFEKQPEIAKREAEKVAKAFEEIIRAYKND